MAYSKASPSGFKLFEDDGTPIEWNEHYNNAWGLGHNDAEVNNPCPFPNNSAYAICWGHGNNTCKSTDNRTPAGRKRKPTIPCLIIKKNNITIGINGSIQEFSKMIKRLGEVKCIAETQEPLHIIHANSAEILIDALQD